MKPFTLVAYTALAFIFLRAVWDVDIWRALLLAYVTFAAYFFGYTAGALKRLDK